LINRYIPVAENKINNISKIRILVWVFLTTSILTCSTPSKIITINFAHLYNPEIEILLPEYQILHFVGNTTKLKLQIPSSQLLYKSELRQDIFTSTFSLHYRVMESFQSKAISDSATVFFKDTLLSEDDYIISKHLELDMPLGNDYWLFLELKDKNSRNKHSRVLPIQKKHPYGPHFFYITGIEGVNFYSPFFIGEKGEYKLNYSDDADFELTASVYPVDSVIPAPPFSELLSDHDGLSFSYPDTTFTIQFTQGNTILPIEKYGIYHLHVPSDPENGFLIYFYHNQFPYLSFWDDMLLPLRYVSTTEEFNNALNYGDARLSVERFWTRITGNPDRSAELIRRYYNRAQQANIMFTSLRSGWQTDKGMIYIIFGPPHMVYKTETGESWHYREGMRTPSARFDFKFIETPYTSNHYILQRDPSYRTAWNIAVDNWRR
jgi:GWxTD domain-containing protein